MNELEKNELPLERVLFFSDAIVAIAITLMALELKLDLPEGQSLHYTDLLRPWHHYLAFLISFINIASFWNLHHRLFIYINKMNDGLKMSNTFWLFFIVILPFSTNVLSDHFNDNAAVFLYALNIVLISLFLRFLWSYSIKCKFVDTQVLDEANQQRINIYLNLDFLNGLIALIVSFFAPLPAFVLLFFKIPLMLFGFFYVASLRKKKPGNNLIRAKRFNRDQESA